MIEAQSGHKVNLTLYGFSMASHTAGAGSGVPPDTKSVPTTGTGTHGCPWTVVVRESNLTVQLPGCTGASREQLVYTSHGGNVQVHLTQLPVTQGTSEAAPVTPILLRYQGKQLLPLCSSSLQYGLTGVCKKQTAPCRTTPISMGRDAI